MLENDEKLKKILRETIDYRKKLEESKTEHSKTL